MGSVQIKAGIWFFSADLKGEVRGSRGGTAIIMTHTKTTSMYLTSLALGVGREIRGHGGVAERLRARRSESNNMQGKLEDE